MICLVVVWVWDGENMIDCMMNMLLALAYPFCCLLYVLWCGFSFAMIINLIDGSRWTRFSWLARKWNFRCLVHVDWTIDSFGLFFRAMAPVFRCSWICKLLVKSLPCFSWHRGVPSFVGVVLITPGLRCSTILCVAFPLNAVLN